MKEDVFDVLLYLFENYIDTDDSNKPDKDALETELEGVGFLHLEIHKAFEWLESMTVIEEESSTWRCDSIPNKSCYDLMCSAEDICCF